MGVSGGGGQSHSSNSSASESYSIANSLSEYFSKAFSQNTSNSQNTSSSQNTSQSGTSESRLSQKQGDILDSREQKFNDVFFPELQNAIAENTPGSAANNAAMEQNANAVNTAYDAAGKATDQTLAQQGLSSAGGVNAALKAANNRARSSSLAQAYYNQLTASQANKTTLLGLMGEQMANPTSSAEYHSSSTGQGTSVSQGTSTAQGTSESESAGTSSSKSKSESWSKSKGKSSSWNAQGSVSL